MRSLIVVAPVPGPGRVRLARAGVGCRARPSWQETASSQPLRRYSPHRRQREPAAAAHPTPTHFLPYRVDGRGRPTGRLPARGDRARPAPDTQRVAAYRTCVAQRHGENGERLEVELQAAVEENSQTVYSCPGS